MSNDPSPQLSATQFWRTLEERSNTEEFRAAIEREFSVETPIWDDLPSRRQFLQSLGASLALAGLAGCVRQPDELIVPQVVSPEQGLSGSRRSFATAMPRPGGALGLLVTSHEGRPIKVEGNSNHRASKGATDVIAQASILDLYDPDRSQVVQRAGDISSFGSFLSEFKDRVEHHRANEGRGLRVVTGPTTSPTLLSQLQALLSEMPHAVWHVNENLPDHNILKATKTAFGAELRPYYHFDHADVVFVLDADPLGHGPDNVRLTREFCNRRHPNADRQMLRCYVAESTLSQTGAIADHRLPIPASELPKWLLSLATRVGLKPAGLTQAKADPELDDHWLNCVAKDLQRAGSRALVIVGPGQSAAVHLLGIAINYQLGSVGTTLTFVPTNHHAGVHKAESIPALIKPMRAGQIETLIVLDTNPCYGVPWANEFSVGLKRVEWALHCGPYVDETAESCQWHVPTPHFLETWSDCRYSDGTATIIQPLIAPLYNSQSPHQILDHVLSKSPRSAYEIVRAYWEEKHGKEKFLEFWGKSLHDGVLAESASSHASPELNPDWANTLKADWPQQLEPRGSDRMEVGFRFDSNVYDGAFANNAWLQEIPRPFTTQTWGNAAWISPADAGRRGLKTGAVVEIATGDRKVRLPVIVQPGQPQGVCTLHLGYGRTRSGRHGTGVGVDVAPLQSEGNPWAAIVATVRASGDTITLAMAQPHHLMENRDLVRMMTSEGMSYPTSSGFAQVGSHQDPKTQDSLYPERIFEGPQWGMVIDQGLCTGCNACVAACQAENNIPSVGAEQVRNGRRMHWLRIDTYYAGDPDVPTTVHQPILCMHCEHAPCEPVCPVAATTHSRDGLNEMTYNRCVGTRYCSNNCPYKVRRFNFLDYHHELKSLPVLQLQPNPDVTVRSRGVMEKCTYCVQRIRREGIAANVAGQELADGDIITACQAACPASAIIFGDITDADSRVTIARADSRNYSLLADLNTRPRTTYQAAVRNPHPDLIAFEDPS